MDIKKLLTEDGKPIACIIEEDGLTYPIRLESLHNPDILDTLLNSGWELYRLPYGLRKGNIDIADLPIGIYSEEGITKEQEVEMAYLRNNLYDNTDLKSKMSVTNVEYVKFRESANLIETREEFLNFLNSIDENKDLIDDQYILPLNAFVKSSALFTVEEYINPKNEVYVRKIENLRQLSIKQFTALNEKFKALGLDSEFTLSKFVNFYFSWGVPGLNIPFLSKEEGIENMRIDATNTVMDEKYKPYYRKRVLTYLDTAGDIYLDPKYQNSGWSPMISEDSILEKASQLKDIGYNYIAPVLIEAKVSEPVTYLTGEVYEVVYDTDICVLRGSNGVRLELPTISVHDPAKRAIKSDLYEKIINKDQSIFEEFYIDAIVQELVKRTRVQIDASSYDALKTTGASDIAISRYIFRDEEIITNYEQSLKDENSQGVGTLGEFDDEEEKEKKKQTKVNFGLQQLIYSGVFVAKAEQYLAGELSKDDMQYEIISRIWEAFTNGELLVDNLQQGKLNDSNVDRELYVEYVKIINRYLGVSLDEICKRVCEIDISQSDDLNLDFEGNGLAARIPAVIVNNTERAYLADVDEYRIKQANDAQYIYYVTGVIEELGGTYSERRHVGLFGKCLKLYDSQIKRKFDMVMQMLSVKYIDLVDDMFGVSQRDFYLDIRKQVIYNWIFQIGINGKYKIPQFLLHDDMDAFQIPNENLLAGVKACLRDFCDSTIQLMNTTISENGSFYSYCPNAIVTPYYVVPRLSNKRGAVEFPVYPFVPAFVNTIGHNFDEKVRHWVQHSMMPPIREADGSIQRGFGSRYNSVCIPLESTASLNELPGSLSRYWEDAIKYRNQMGTEYNLGNPQHPYDKVTKGAETEFDKEPRKDGLTTPQMWRIETRYMTNKEEFIRKNPGFTKLFNPQKVLALGEVGFMRFNGYEASDFLGFVDFEDLSYDKPLAGDIPLVGVSTKFEGVTSEGVFKYTDVENMYETGNFKIKKVNGRKYIFEDYKGNLIGVIV